MSEEKRPFWFEGMTRAEADRWRKPPAVLILLGLCIGIFGVQSIAPELQVYDLLFFTAPANWFESYRLFTPVFLHFSILHIAFNLALFWFFGRQIETLRGTAVLLIIVLVCGLISNIAQYMAQGERFGGMSGVVMALISFVWMDVRWNRRSRLFMPRGLMLFVVLSLALGFTGILDQIFGPIAHVAHALGFIAGILLWLVLFAFRSWRSPAA